MDDMIQAICSAEEQATQIKLKAQDEAQKIVDDARAKALKIENDGAISRAEEGADIISKAEKKAQAEYDSFIENKGREAERYTATILSKTDPIVGKIVGRVSGGNR
jgi:vacuolar-type H+-ATPase subunit H